MNEFDLTQENTPSSDPAGAPELLGLDPAALLAGGFDSAAFAPRRASLWEPPSPEALSLLLPEYQIESLLGRGGMGAVYRGVQAMLHRPVAIKLLPAEMAANAQFVARFQREARTLAKLQHPGIVTVFDFGQTGEGHLYFVMEFVNGTDLRHLMETSGLNSAQTLSLIAEICDALHYAHQAGVVHRDIKPANILITRAGRAKVADFGIARPAEADDEHLTSENLVMGTPAYMAPEQREGRADERADIYSLGVILYEMLTGQRPHGVFDPPSRKVQIDVRIDEVVLKALQQEPDRRYQRAREMKTDVDHIRTTPSQPSPPAAKKPKPSARVPIALGLLGLLAIGAVGMWVKGKQVPRSTEKVLVSTSPRDSEHASRVDSQPMLWPASPLTAAKDRPWENSLGMKFVPVLIGSGPTAGQSVLFGVWVTRVKDFAAFVDATGHEATKQMTSLEIEKDGIDHWKEVGRNWKEPGFPQTGEHPVVGVSWEDAKAFCAWLTVHEQRTGNLPAGWCYRLPSDHEWSCAAGIGDLEDPNATPRQKDGKIPEIYPWGEQWPPPQGAGNYAGVETKAGMSDAWLFLPDYDDGYPRTSPVGKFTSNRSGLYDLGGNVAQFCEDLVESNRPSRTLRGIPWNNSNRRDLLLSQRWSLSPGRGYASMGFRCVLASSAIELVASPSKSAKTAAAAATPSPPINLVPIPSEVTATRDKPWENSLGMKFVPLPGTGIFMCVHETRKADYAAYAAASPGVDNSWKDVKREGVPVSFENDHPVVMVNWSDAKAFCTWLSTKEGRTYRLPTDREWSIAVGIADRAPEAATAESLNAKVTDQYPWGTHWPPPQGAGNYADRTYKETLPPGKTIDGPGKSADDYTDGYTTTAPVMKFTPNIFGIYDLGGNVWEWCEDWLDAEQKVRVSRGGSWGNGEAMHMWSSRRHRYFQNARSVIGGFRCVLVRTAIDPPLSVEPSKVKPIQSDRSALGDSSVAPKKTKYRNYKGESKERYAWKGKQVTVLSATGDLDSRAMSQLLDKLDKAHDFYRNATGREPNKEPDSEGRAILLEDETSPTSYHTRVGTAMVRMRPATFRSFVAGVAERNEYAAAWFREFGINNWHFGAQLTPKGVAHYDAFFSGYCVLMRSLAVESLGIRLDSKSGDGGDALRHGIEELLEIYLSNTQWTFGNTLGASVAPTNSLNLGAPDLFASFCLRLCKDNGGVEYNGKLWRKVAERPEAKTAQDAIDNFILAACAAAGKDLSALFTTQWRWPLSERAVAEAKNLVATKKPAADFVAHWKADGDAKDSAASHHGTLYGSAGFAPGKDGRAFAFKGSTGSVSVPNSVEWAFGAADFSIALWVKFSTISGDMALLACDDGAGSRNKWILRFNREAIEWHMAGTASATLRSAPFTPKSGEWHHLAVTRTGSIFRFLVDGAEISALPWAGAVPLAKAPLTIGEAESNFRFNGLLDDLRIYHRALSQPEIKALVDSAGTP